MQDLLRPENENLQIRESDTGVFVAGVHETEVKGMEDCLHLLQLGERNRYTDRLFRHVPLQSAPISSISQQCPHLLCTVLCCLSSWSVSDSM